LAVRRSRRKTRSTVSALPYKIAASRDQGDGQRDDDVGGSQGSPERRLQVPGDPRSADESRAHPSARQGERGRLTAVTPRRHARTGSYPSKPWPTPWLGLAALPPRKRLWWLAGARQAWRLTRRRQRGQRRLLRRRPGWRRSSLLPFVTWPPRFKERPPQARGAAHDDEPRRAVPCREGLFGLRVALLGPGALTNAVQAQDATRQVAHGLLVQQDRSVPPPHRRLVLRPDSDRHDKERPK